MGREYCVMLTNDPPMAAGAVKSLLGKCPVIMSHFAFQSQSEALNLVVRLRADHEENYSYTRNGIRVYRMPKN